MNIFGKPLVLNTNDVLKTVNAKIKLADVENENKFVNETGDKITSLQITEEPKNLLDAVNLKYIKKLEDEAQVKYENFKQELKTETKVNIEKENEKIKSEIKSDYEKIKSEIKSDYEKFKKEINIEITGYRNKIIELNNQVEELEKKFESHLKLFNLLNKNVTKWHGEVENRLPAKKEILTANEEVILDKIKEKIRKIKEKAT